MASRPVNRTGRGRSLGIVLAGLAIALVAAGFGAAGTFDRPSPSAPPELAQAETSASPAPTPTPTPFVVPRQSLLPTPVIREDLFTPPPPTPKPTPKPDIADGPTNRVATRVVVPELGIDLPVTRQRTSYPACGVAMYLPRFKQPGQGGPTYLYAHARRGMFLPLLEQSKRNNGQSMIGMEVHVYTGDNIRFRYEITRVRRHARDFNPVVSARGETIWLQTSEGPNASYPKLQVAGTLVGRQKVSHAEAHPKPHPRSC